MRILIRGSILSTFLSSCLEPHNTEKDKVEDQNKYFPVEFFIISANGFFFLFHEHMGDKVMFLEFWTVFVLSGSNVVPCLMEVLRRTAARRRWRRWIDVNRRMFFSQTDQLWGRIPLKCLFSLLCSSFHLSLSHLFPSVWGRWKETLARAVNLLYTCCVCSDCVCVSLLIFTCIV